MDDLEETLDLATWITEAHGLKILKRSQDLLDAGDEPNLDAALVTVLQQDRQVECEQGVAIGALNCNS